MKIKLEKKRFLKKTTVELTKMLVLFIKIHKLYKLLTNLIKNIRGKHKIYRIKNKKGEKNSEPEQIVLKT